MRVALVTQACTPQGNEEDQGIRAALAEVGLEAFPLVWGEFDKTRPEDLVLIRSPWDYFERPEAFLRWTESVPGRVMNPPPVLRWNACKSYLAGMDCPKVPTLFWRPGEPIPEVSWERLVVKPAVSAGAVNTERISRGELGTWLGRQSALTLIQPFLDSIAMEGEWSMVFFEGIYSHAVRKIPGRGDFRVQESLGGSVLVERPPASLVAFAETIATRNLYARVDLVPWEGSWVLGELELIEPFLYLKYDEGATERLVAAITRLCEPARLP